jgi:hypothetical protein
VCGYCRGVDILGDRWARENNIPIKYFPANWTKHGKSAGYIRNREMVEYADALIAIRKNNSKGTGHTINFAKKKGIPTYVVEI